jgi:hypothetical protein
MRVSCLTHPGRNKQTQVEEGEERRRLSGLVAALRSAMVDAVVDEGQGEEAFTPHVTLFKTSKDRDAVVEANR